MALPPSLLAQTLASHQLPAYPPPPVGDRWIRDEPEVALTRVDSGDDPRAASVAVSQREAVRDQAFAFWHTTRCGRFPMLNRRAAASPRQRSHRRRVRHRWTA